MANEKRLIDANALMEEMKECAITRQDLYCNGYAQTFIENAPTVDAVEVVRCKDCKQWGGVAFGNVCRRWSAPLAGMKNCTKADDFCSYGERRTDNG